MIDRPGHDDQDFAEGSFRDDGLGTSAPERWLRELDAATGAEDGPDVDKIKLRARVEILEQWFAEIASPFDEETLMGDLATRVAVAIRDELGVVPTQVAPVGSRMGGVSQVLRWAVPAALAASVGVVLFLSSASRESAESSTQYVDALLGSGQFEGEAFAPDFDFDRGSAVDDIEEDLAAIEVAGLDWSGATIDDSIDDLEDELGTLDALRGESWFQFELGGETGA